jgi:hypothetical protein
LRFLGLCLSQILRLVLWCQNRAAHAGSHELARSTCMHWSAAQFQVTRVRRVNLFASDMKGFPSVYIIIFLWAWVKFVILNVRIGQKTIRTLFFIGFVSMVCSGPPRIG